MRSSKRCRAVATAVVLVLAAASAGPASGVAHAASGTSVRSSGLLRLTLVTGDELTLRAGKNGGVAADRDTPVVTAKPGAGRKHVGFVTRKEDGDTYVIPSDAVALVGTGRVDKRLFDVSLLVEGGYQDTARDTVPVIVAGTAGTSALTGTKAVRALPGVGGSAVTVAKADAAGFWGQVTGHGSSARTLAGGVTRLWLDGRVRASLDRSVPQIGAPAAWAAGYTGTGVKVAVLDTGIDTTHPDLADAVVAAQDFSRSTSGTTDRYGHGTHVAGIITGDGAASGGKYKGVAPDAKLLNGKVLDDTGAGYESDVIAGLQWATDQGADVVNLSLGGAPSAGDEPLDLAVDELTRSTGTLFVIAAGNDGPGADTVESPAAADEALAVGAVDRDNALADFSSRGPREGDLALKPDITAPGVGIVAPLAAGSVLSDVVPHVDDRYVALSGTSMATPHVAGAAALLAGQHPDWHANELKSALMGSARPTAGESVYSQGAGRVDVARAVAQPVFALPASISNGTALWPHDDDAPITKDVTYHNAGTAPLTLDLSVDTTAPAGMFTVAPSRLTVAAGGTATAKLTTDTSVPAADGMYSAVLLANGGPTVVRTPVGVYREIESYSVDVKVLDRNGKPTPNYLLRLVNVANADDSVRAYDPSGSLTVRVPKGHFYLEAQIENDDPSVPAGFDNSLLVEPDYVVGRPTRLVLDARDAKPVGFTLDRTDAKQVSGALVFERTTNWGDTGVYLSTDTFDGLYVRPSKTSAPRNAFTFQLLGQYARPGAGGDFMDSPYTYHVSWGADRSVPDRLIRRVRDREFAAVRTEIAASAPGQVFRKDNVPVHAPTVLTELYTPGVSWEQNLSGNSTFEQSPTRTFKLGVPVVERWNRAVLAPGLPDPHLFGPTAARYGDEIGFDLALNSGQGNGHWGGSYDDPASLTLSRDGQVIGTADGSSAVFTVPSKQARYTLSATTTHPTSTISTKVDAAWSFQSGHASDDGVTIPFMAVRFAPDVDADNSAPAGRPYTIPVSVQKLAGPAYGDVRTMRVDVSYDDGKTWQAAPLTGTRWNRIATVKHPAGPGYVSLRAKAEDTNGNTVEVTVIRAYILR